MDTTNTPAPLAENNPDTSVTFRPIPSQTFAHFKAVCARHRFSMIDVQVAFMKQAQDFVPKLRLKRKRARSRLQQRQHAIH